MRRPNRCLICKSTIPRHTTAMQQNTVVCLLPISRALSSVAHLPHRHVDAFPVHFLSLHDSLEIQACDALLSAILVKPVCLLMARTCTPAATAEPLYINLASISKGAGNDQQDMLRTLSTLQHIEVDDVVMHTSADDELDGSDGEADEADAPEADRSMPLTWATAGRDATVMRTSMDKFDRLDFDRVGHRIERPIGPRAPTTFTLYPEWFPHAWTTIK
eukprot:m.9525 g.9525  ORF g.9525 m.9525 type:complete len:218 (-) comp2643_c0_seq2:226-879(-)